MGSAVYSAPDQRATGRLNSGVRAQMRERSWSRLPFYDPKGVLIALNALSEEVAAADLPYNLASLRTNGLKPYREGRQCALFCYGVGQRFGIDVRYAASEEQDFDFVARFERDGCVNFVPLQMKELVPEHVKSSVSLQGEIDKLEKYVDSSDLVVAFHLNRELNVVPEQLDFSRIRLAQLWFVGYTGCSPEWLLLGDMLSAEPGASVFRYPEP
jgi:hypothetical protein